MCIYVNFPDCVCIYVNFPDCVCILNTHSNLQFCQCRGVFSLLFKMFNHQGIFVMQNVDMGPLSLWPLSKKARHQMHYTRSVKEMTALRSRAQACRGTYLTVALHRACSECLWKLSMWVLKRCITKERMLNLARNNAARDHIQAVQTHRCSEHWHTNTPLE